MEMRVGELARRTGVGVSTLRAWERRFRFPEPRRSPAGHRLYDSAEVERVEAVVRLVGEGLTLAAAIARVAMAGAGALPDGEGEALLFGQILEAANQGVWVSRDGRTRYANRRMAEIMRCSSEELLAVSVLQFFDAEELPLVKERTALARAGQRLHFVQKLRRLDGSTFLAEIDTTPLLNQAGRYEGSVSLVSDVTARNEADTQAQLRATLLDAVGEAVAAADLDGKIVYLNAAAERLFGWRASEVIGRDGRALLAAPEAAEDADRIHGALLKGRRYEGRLTLTRRDGSRFVAQLTSGPAVDERGVQVGLVAVLRDQTERDQADRDMRARELQAETLALLGAQALRDQTRVVTEAVEATRRLLRADQTLLLEFVDGDDELEVRAGSPGVDERITVPTGSGSFAGYVALARKFVVVDNTEFDTRFDRCPDSTTASAIGAPVFGPDGIRGVLTAESSTPSRFDQHAGHFIQSMANIIGSAYLA